VPFNGCLLMGDPSDVTGHVASVLFLPQPHASQYRNEKMRIAAIHRIYCPKDLPAIFLHTITD
jgi:hypothetical protein